MTTVRIVGAAAAFAAALAAGGCGPAEEKAAPLNPVRPVHTFVVPEPGAGRERVFAGTLRAAVQTPLSFRVGGEIVDLPAQMGRTVRGGDVLARLDPVDYELQLKQQEAQAAVARAQVNQTRSDYERACRLYETENMSQSELDAAEAAYKAAVAQQESSIKAVELARQQLDYCVLRAPADGSLGEVLVEQHQSVSPGQSVSTLNSGGEMLAQIGVPETLIGRVRLGDAAVVVCQTLDNAAFPASVTEIGVMPAESRAYPVKLTLKTDDPRLRFGMAIEARLPFQAEAGAEPVVIPLASVVQTPDGRRWVWVFEEADSVVRRREVEIGDVASDGVEIRKGLRPGERIVTRGVHQLNEGQKVRLLEQAG